MYNDHVAFFYHFELLQLHFGAFFRPFFIGERLEVVKAHQVCSGLVHLFDVQGIFDPPHEVFAKSVTAAGNLVDVAARNGVVAGMEFLRHRIHADDVDIVGQQVIQFLPNQPHRHFGAHVQVRHLSEGVYTCVGAPRAIYFYLFGFKYCFCSFDQ